MNWNGFGRRCFRGLVEALSRNLPAKIEVKHGKPVRIADAAVEI
jgi:hypothetical protein